MFDYLRSLTVLDEMVALLSKKEINEGCKGSWEVGLELGTSAGLLVSKPATLETIAKRH